MGMESESDRSVRVRDVTVPQDVSLEGDDTVAERALAIVGAPAIQENPSGGARGIFGSKCLRAIADMRMRPIQVARILIALYSSGIAQPSQADMFKALNASHASYQSTQLARAKETAPKLFEAPQKEWENFLLQIETPVRALQKTFNDTKSGSVRALRIALYDVFMGTESNLIEQRGWADSPAFWKKLETFLGHKTNVQPHEMIRFFKQEYVDGENRAEEKARYARAEEEIRGSEAYRHLQKLCGVTERPAEALAA
jgi:hypothetical protein